MRIPSRRSVLATVLTALACTAASAQTSYPTRPVRLVVGFAAGTGPDIVARLVGQKLAEGWGVGVVVDNKPGGA